MERLSVGIRREKRRGASVERESTMNVSKTGGGGRRERESLVQWREEW